MENKQHIDYLIVGQGLAGTLLSYFLLLENQRVIVIDHPYEGRTSNIAAGLVNPVTGRRIAKSWRFEEFYAFAKETYHLLEAMLEVKLWRDRTILRALHSVFEENEWARRSGYPEFQAFMQDSSNTTDLEGKMKPPHAWGELLSSAQVAMPLLIDAWHKYLTKRGLFYVEEFDYQGIGFENDKVSYGQWTAKKLIFCEGALAVKNPFFNHLPFLPTKGELLLLRIPGLPNQRILKHKLFFVPLEDELFWVGSTSSYEFEEPKPSEAGLRYLMKELGQSLDIPYEVKDHLAGIRPTVSDIRPFLGLHPANQNLGIFNGLGTKGALLGPFFAKQMADFLLGHEQLEADVDIARLEGGSRSGHYFS